MKNKTYFSGSPLSVDILSAKTRGKSLHAPLPPNSGQDDVQRFKTTNDRLIFRFPRESPVTDVRLWTGVTCAKGFCARAPVCYVWVCLLRLRVDSNIPAGYTEEVRYHETINNRATASNEFIHWAWAILIPPHRQLYCPVAFPSFCYK